jgi:hypothetical protein
MCVGMWVCVCVIGGAQKTFSRTAVQNINKVSQ